MFKLILKRVFGTRNQRLIKQLLKVVEKINAFEKKIQTLDDAALKAKTQEFRQRFQQGEALEQLLPEAFAVVREASQRTLGLRHFDVQLIGGVVLHQGKIAEMRTGEGKTLVATLPVYLNAITGKGVHLVTVNDYLAKRDADWMRPIYEFLELTVGINLPNMSQEEKRNAYCADVTYGTNNEFGFDYLRDNMVFRSEDKVQRGLAYAIVDEVDSILIDEARTPLIISGPAEESSGLYEKIDAIVPKLTKQEEENGPGDYAVDEKSRQVFLTESGHDRVEALFIQTGLLNSNDSLYDVSNILLLHYLHASLKAYSLFKRDVDYIVKDGQIVIVDEHTGRMMQGRRWSEGLHQAVEAKEKVQVQQENQTLASITFQNFFRIYDKLAGMTGTADTEAYEFQQIYNLEVVVIPTNKPIKRHDHADRIYMNEKAKYRAIVKDIKERTEKNQPILVGTASIDSSERLAKHLQEEKIPHQILNAKYHEKEAKIIAQAGKPSTVTIATNMAGRGTDIILGGNSEAAVAELENPTQAQIDTIKEDGKKANKTVIEAGGLHILGTERNESRRIDNQLRGRSGRQGDPGSSRFYLSLEDNLMRIFAREWLTNFMRRLNMPEDEPIEMQMVSRAIENAQRKVEGFNFDMRKQLLEYDDVANDQRTVVYKLRDSLMETEDVAETLEEYRIEAISHCINQFISPQSLEEQWDVPGLEKSLLDDFDLKLDIQQMLAKDENLHEENLRDLILEEIKKDYQKKCELMPEESIQRLERGVMLQTLDGLWKEHLASMDHLRQGIHLRGYAQKNPKQEYKREAFDMFTQLLENYKYDVISTLSKVQIEAGDEDTMLREQQRKADDVTRQMQFIHPGAQVQTGLPEEKNAEAQISDEKPPITYVREGRKVGRNEPCPCGSGKKYKQCHGKLK